MAQLKDAQSVFVFQAQQKIFNKLCIAYRRSRERADSTLRAEDVRCELSLRESVFTEALNGFVDAAGERIVEEFIRDGQRHLRLGDCTRFNLSDWAGRTYDNRRRRRYSEAAPGKQQRMFPVVQLAKRAR